MVHDNKKLSEKDFVKKQKSYFRRLQIQNASFTDTTNNIFYKVERKKFGRQKAKTNYLVARQDGKRLIGATKFSLKKDVQQGIVNMLRRISERNQIATRYKEIKQIIMSRENAGLFRDTRVQPYNKLKGKPKLIQYVGKLSYKGKEEVKVYSKVYPNTKKGREDALFSLKGDLLNKETNLGSRFIYDNKEKINDDIEIHDIRVITYY